ncbi:MAG: hypothetical protein HDR41_00655 [Lactobacillus sp.]|nr:hypothetical protein [Lactobacillus sp.]
MFNRKPLTQEEKEHLEKHFAEILNGEIEDFIILGLNKDTGAVINHESGHKIIINGLLHDSIRKNEYESNQNDHTMGMLGGLASLLDVDNDN